MFWRQGRTKAKRLMKENPSENVFGNFFHLWSDGDVEGKVFLEVADVFPHRCHLHLLRVFTLRTLDTKLSEGITLTTQICQNTNVYLQDVEMSHTTRLHAIFWIFKNLKLLRIRLESFAIF